MKTQIKIRRRLRQVSRFGNGAVVFTIKSRSRDDGTEYLVTVNPGGSIFCNCPSHRPCWHLDRALLNLRRAVHGSTTRAGRSTAEAIAVKSATANVCCGACFTENADNYFDACDDAGNVVIGKICNSCARAAVESDLYDLEEEYEEAHA